MKKTILITSLLIIIFAYTVTADLIDTVETPYWQPEIVNPLIEYDNVNTFKLDDTHLVFIGRDTTADITSVNVYSHNGNYHNLDLISQYNGTSNPQNEIDSIQIDSEHYISVETILNDGQYMSMYEINPTTYAITRLERSKVIGTSSNTPHPSLSKIPQTNSHAILFDRVVDTGLGLTGQNTLVVVNWSNSTWTGFTQQDYATTTDTFQTADVVALGRGRGLAIYKESGNECQFYAFVMDQTTLDITSTSKHRRVETNCQNWELERYNHTRVIAKYTVGSTSSVVGVSRVDFGNNAKWNGATGFGSNIFVTNIERVGETDEYIFTYENTTDNSQWISSFTVDINTYVFTFNKKVKIAQPNATITYNSFSLKESYNLFDDNKSIYYMNDDSGSYSTFQNVLFEQFTYSHAPIVTTVSVDPLEIETFDSVDGYCTATDSDSSTITAFFNWTVNGQLLREGNTTINNNTETLVDTLPTAETQYATTYTFTCYVQDEYNTSMAQSTTFDAVTPAGTTGGGGGGSDYYSSGQCDDDEFKWEDVCIRGSQVTSLFFEVFNNEICPNEKILIQVYPLDQLNRVMEIDSMEFIVNGRSYDMDEVVNLYTYNNVINLGNSTEYEIKFIANQEIGDTIYSYELDKTILVSDQCSNFQQLSLFADRTRDEFTTTAEKFTGWTEKTTEERVEAIQTSWIQILIILLGGIFLIVMMIEGWNKLGDE